MLVFINSMLGIYGETMVFQHFKNQREMSILRTEMEGKLALKSISFTLRIYNCRTSHAVGRDRTVRLLWYAAQARLSFLPRNIDPKQKKQR
jgi:hypothetical protein